MLLSLLIIALLVSETGSQFDPRGTWSISTGSSPATLVLELGDGDSVSGLFTTAGGECEVSGTLLTDEEDETSVEGTWNCNQGGAEFEFYPDEDGGYELLVIPFGADGAPRSDLVEFWPALRSEPSAAPALVSPLVGTWSTQVVMNSPQGSIATQMFMEIRAEGTLHDLGSRSVGGGADWGAETGLLGAGESANWRTRGDTLEISYQGSPWVPLARYLVRGNQLTLAWHDGGTGIWHREQP